MQREGAQQREGDAAAQLQPVAARQLDLLLPFQPARVGPAAVPRLQRWPTGAVGPHSPAMGPRGRHSAPKAAARTAQASARQAIARPPRAPYLNSAVYFLKKWSETPYLNSAVYF